MSERTAEEANALYALMMEEHNDNESRDSYVKAPFGWTGGKFHSLRHLLPLLPYRKTWVEPCGGSGVVTLNRRPSTIEVFNDRHSGIVSFYRVIRDPVKHKRLMDRLKMTVKHSREEFLWCRDTWKDVVDDVERAARWYYMLRVSFSQLGRNFGRAINSPPQQAKALCRSLNLFPYFHTRFELIQVENLDAIQCIRDYDSHDTAFYVDPDYIDTDPGIYQHRVQHDKLLQVIDESKGFFAVSGYANELYDKKGIWDDRRTWEVMVSAQAMSFNEENSRSDLKYAVGRESKAEEVLWIREAK